MSCMCRIFERQCAINCGPGNSRAVNGDDCGHFVKCGLRKGLARVRRH